MCCDARKPKPTWTSLLLALLLLAAPLPARAQAETTPSSVGLGGHVGDPTGLVLRIHPRLGQAVDILFALDRERYRYVTAHLLMERFMPNSPLQLYAGPGLMTGSVVSDGDFRYALGGSIMVGTQFYRGRMGIFLHVLPQLRLLPTRQFNGAAGIGFRYYLRRR
ncbi:MAG: RNA polymerase subunit sigma-54 [Bacteroidota bacterium]